MCNRILKCAIGVLVLAALATAAVWFAGPGAQPRTTSLHVESTPERASVWVNGRFAGVTPVTAEGLAPGEAVVRMEKFGYEDAIRRLDLPAGETRERIELAELPRGTLAIDSVPEGADVFIDGEARGQTPITVTGLAVGTRSVRLGLVNYLDWTATVDVASGETVRRKVELRSRTEAGYLAEIARDPKNVTAYCDLAHYYILQAEWKKAEGAFASALVVSAREPSAAAYSGRLDQEIQKVWGMSFKYSDVNEGRRAVTRAFIRAIDEYPSYQRYYGTAITYATSIGMSDEAQVVIERGILAFPHSTSWVTQTSGRGRGRPRGDDRSLTGLEQKIKRNPKDFVSRYQRMILLQADGETDEVVTEYEAMLPLVKNAEVRTRMLADLGRLYERKRDYANAVTAYRDAAEALKDPKERAPLYYNLARVSDKLERADDTVAAWENAIASQDNVELACRWRLDWAQACIKFKKNDEARRLLNDVLKLSNDAKTRETAQELLKNL